jgi:hypothetical protein
MGIIDKNLDPNALPPGQPQAPAEQGEPAGDPATPDNTPAHENAESPQLEQQEGSEEDGGGDDPESNPAYRAGLDLIHKTLYKDGAAQDIATALKSSDNPIEEIGNTAYEILVAIDEKTKGSIPDELIVALAVETMSEVAEIAEAAGIKIGGTEVANAMKTMLTRYAQESGADVTQLMQALGQADMGQLGKALDSAKAGE